MSIRSTHQDVVIAIRPIIDLFFVQTEFAVAAIGDLRHLIFLGGKWTNVPKLVFAEQFYFKDMVVNLLHSSN